MASSFPTTPSKIALPRPTPWFCFLSRDTQIRTISHVVSATRPDRFAAIRSASGLVGWVLLRARGEGLPAGSARSGRLNFILVRSFSLITLGAFIRTEWIARATLNDEVVRAAFGVCAAAP